MSHIVQAFRIAPGFLRNDPIVPLPRGGTLSLPLIVLLLVPAGVCFTIHTRRLSVCLLCGMFTSLSAFIFWFSPPLSA